MGILRKMKLSALKRKRDSVTALLRTDKANKDRKLAEELTAMQAALTSKITELEGKEQQRPTRKEAA